MRRLVPAANGGWTAAGVDEFLRAYLTRRGRAAFYAAARNIYLDEPYGENGFWTRLKALQGESLFVWGRKDTLVPIGFMKHVEKALPNARHVELECGHVPQVERPRETHAAIAKFLAAVIGVELPAGPRLPSLVQAGIRDGLAVRLDGPALAPLRRHLLLALPDLRARGVRGRPRAR